MHGKCGRAEIGSSAKIVLKREDYLLRSHCDAISVEPSTVVAEEPSIRDAMRVIEVVDSKHASE
jgi:hypothetical protein